MTRLWTGGTPSENSWLRPRKWVEVLYVPLDKVGQTLIGVFGEAVYDYQIGTHKQDRSGV